MLPLIIPAAIGALLGAGLGYFGQCSSGTCPLTSTWWRGALYGAVLGAMFGFVSGRNPALSSSGAADSTNLVHLGDADFDAKVLRSDMPVMVDFYAPWCGPCKILGPTVAKLADDYSGRVMVAKVNVDNAPALSQRYQIQGIPTLIFFNGGKPVDTIVGLPSEKDLRAKIQGLSPR